MEPLVITVANLDETELLGRRLGSMLFPGAVVGLVGPLGAGKTHLTRAIAEGLQVENPHAVNSPTFVLIQEYPGPIPVYHFDTYRLPGTREFAELGVEEYFLGQGVCIVEWSDRVAETLPTGYLRIEILPTSPNDRRFVMTGGKDYDSILTRLSELDPKQGP